MKRHWRHIKSTRLLSAMVAVGVLVSAHEARADPFAGYYWNVFNVEGENGLSAQIVTYATLNDMFLDTNRTGVFTPNITGFGRNIVGSGSDGSSYWNVFNVEEESGLSAQMVTYASLDDMLLDTNRTGVFTPNTAGFGRNIVGSGADGHSYWNVFNVEGESGLSAQIVTYASLADMFLDANRTGVFTPNTAGFGRNIVGSGSDGSSYWNVFNVEGESGLSAQMVTYTSLADMLLDANRTGVFTPNTAGFGRNIIGSGADIVSPTSTVPEPISMALLGTGLVGMAGVARRRRLKKGEVEA